MRRSSIDYKYLTLFARSIVIMASDFARSTADLLNPKPGHTTGGSGRSARRSGRAVSGKIGCQQNYSPRGKKFTIFEEIAETSPLRLSRSTNKRNSMLTDGGTKSAVDQRFISGLSPGRKARFVPGCRKVGRRFYASVNPSHARHVRE